MSAARPRPVPPERRLVVWCPDWPVVAARAAAGMPGVPGQAADTADAAAVFAANRVVACSPAARRSGIGLGMRRREAQARCPELAVFAEDTDTEARLFESVASAVEDLVVGVEVVRPGLVAVPVDRATAYFGGELPLAERLVDHVAARAGVECQVGVADGLFAATLAAYRGAFVGAGAGAEFLAPLPVTELNQPGAERSELVELLRRLGLRTLGAFAALAERDVLSRFGRAGLVAHRLARGRDERPPLRRTPPPELALTESFDPPLDRVDTAAFTARTLATRFHTGLASRGLACTRLGIYATTENGEELGRVWRCAEPLTADGVADRVRWQFEGWLRAASGRPTAGVDRLRLVPEELVAGRSLQLGLWPGGGSAEHTPESDRAARALVHVQGLLGPEGAVTAVLDGGRGPGERVRPVPWGERRTPAEGHDAPWPGRVPAPSPATVHDPRGPARVVTDDGTAVEITARNEVTGAPALVAVGDDPPRRVLGWSGPWVVQARWWAPEHTGVHARVQVVLEGRDDAVAAFLLRWDAECDPAWSVEGTYD
ncbi:DNA polymerase Y family protein [Saccharomonospora piscinae]|uniref:DNA polymerase Y family protein n=1 Tax=Saccharomonospora piscinae TaxID=687388 RepID=UPI0011072F83|nr:DNA polymerase Y family protein [Saccharomonospora piscinae]TLW93853.1 DNA polymerase Y family protein [Saccharomonospora piscinae]